MAENLELPYKIGIIVLYSKFELFQHFQITCIAKTKIKAVSLLHPIILIIYNTKATQMNTEIKFKNSNNVTKRKEKG